MARLGETGDGAPSVSAVSGFESDLADLIDDHVRACGGDLSFDAFRARWQSRSFSFVHNARLVELLEGEYAQMLFSATMPYLAPDAGPTVRRIAALYALHLLYHTQQLAPRARVYVTPRDVRRLAQLVETCVEMGAADAVRAAKELVDDHAFAVGASDERARRRWRTQSRRRRRPPAPPREGRRRGRRREHTRGTRCGVRSTERRLPRRFPFPTTTKTMTMTTKRDEARGAFPTKRRARRRNRKPRKPRGGARARASPRLRAALSSIYARHASPARSRRSPRTRRSTARAWPR